MLFTKLLLYSLRKHTKINELNCCRLCKYLSSVLFYFSLICCENTKHHIHHSPHSTRSLYHSAPDHRHIAIVAHIRSIRHDDDEHGSEPRAKEAQLFNRSSHNNHLPGLDRSPIHTTSRRAHNIESASKVTQPHRCNTNTTHQPNESS